MKIVIRIVLMALVYAVVSLLVKKLLWQEQDITSTKELVKTGVVALIFATLLVLISNKKAKKQNSESIQ